MNTLRDLGLAISLRYTGPRARTEQSKPQSKRDSSVTTTDLAPAVSEDFPQQPDCPRAGVVHDELRARVEEGAADGDREKRGKGQMLSFSGRLSPGGRRAVSVSAGLATVARVVSRPETNAGDAMNSVFGGALGFFFVSPIRDPLAAASTNRVPAAEVERPPEKYFVAYGHSLLAGAGTGVYDEAAEAAAAAGHPSRVMGQLMGGDFGGTSGRARVSEKRRLRRYGDALEIFQEGLRRFPRSPALLYGTSFTMQVSMNVLN